MNSKKIAVIGAGIYGITIALELAKNHSVDLFEKNTDILMAASGINQYRLHRGYHYPRADNTVKEALACEKPFAEMYSEAIIKNEESYYCIAKEKSLTSKKDFVDFCNKHGLDFEEAESVVIDKDNSQLIVKVKEDSIDPTKLREVCWKKLKNSSVNISLNKEVGLDSLKDYDYIINCTYSHLNHLLKDNHYKRDFKFQLCEKPVVELPKSIKNKNIVVIDGPFTCLDSFGKTGLGVMGHVVHAVHHTNIGKYPEIPVEYASLLNKGIVKNPPKTNFHKFIESARDFIPEIKNAKHIGSMFTIRTVLPNVSATDERPIIIERVDDRIINAFAGKLAGCVLASREISKIINKENEAIKKQT